MLRARPIQHSENLEDVRVSIIAFEFIACAVEAQDELPAVAGNLDAVGVWQLQVVSVGRHGTGWAIAREQ